MAKRFTVSSTGRRVYGGAAETVRRSIGRSTTAKAIAALGITTKASTAKFASGILGATSKMGGRIRREMGPSTPVRRAVRSVVAGGGAVPGESISKGTLKAAMKGPAGGIISALIMAYFTGTQYLEHKRGMATLDVQEQALQGADPMDQYYAAALPELQQERQMAQQALMQMIMGGQGIPLQVPGERMIGGQGGQGSGY